MLYLVTGMVHESHYMSDSSTTKTLRLVEANSAEEAEKKFEDHYSALTKEYDVYFFVSSAEASEMIS